MIASVMLGARQARRITRLTYEGLMDSAAAISSMEASMEV
jgi:hypothetical protein